MHHDELLQLGHEVLGGTVSGQYLLPDEIAFVAERGEGAYLFDVRGRRYIDYMLGSGPVLLGHGHPEVVAAVVEQAALGSTYYVPNAKAFELAGRIVDVMPCAEQVKFTSSGSDATFYALRIARVFTGRSKILKFAGGFHGSHDVGMMNGFSEPAFAYPCSNPDSDGVTAGVADEVIVSRWNDVDMTTELISTHAHELAAVICEPMQRCLVAAPGFLQLLRDLTTQHGLLLIFDEMVTGFRFALGGAQERYGVVPDMATFGKALTNGHPMSGIAGRREIIDVTHPSRHGVAPIAYFGNTLNGNPLCAAAGVATLNVLARDGVYERLESVTQELRSGIAERAGDLGISVQLLGDGPVFQLAFADHEILDLADLQRADGERFRRFLHGCVARGVLSSGKFYVSLAHSDNDVAETLEVIGAVLAEV
jgi:glutamate-1-semialdehyde 2,1-aminomutase